MTSTVSLTNENISKKMMKALKVVNFISGKSLEEQELKKHRKIVEFAGKMAAPKSDISINRFEVGTISCEEITPDYAHNPKYAILYAHGGGYICGGLDYARVLGAKLALSTGFTTYTFDYGLAPENTYPTALNDGMAIWEWLINDKYDSEHILLAGDSAGGNLALCMAQRLLKDNCPMPKALLLFSPWTDMTGTSKSYETNKDSDPILTKDYVMSAARAYVAENGELDDERFSPLFGNLANLPPILVMAGKNGILLDDSVNLAKRIRAAGGNVQLDVEKKGWHVYQQMPVPIAGRAMKRLSKYVTSLIYGD